MKNGKPLVWILDDEWTNHQMEKEIFNENGFLLKVTSSKTVEQDFPLFAPYADGVIAQVGFSCDQTIINELNSCKVIATYGVGFNHIDIAAATRKGIPVCNVPDYCVEEVSDHTIALIFSVTRRIQSYSAQVKRGHWDALNTLPIKRFKDNTVGLLGFGRIARAVAAKLKPFGARLIAHDNYVPKQVFEEYAVTPVTFEELIQQSNLLSLHVPLSPETANILNYDRMKMMPRGAFIINTSRGGIVNEEDLTRLLDSGHLGGAGLDVLKQEPPSVDHPLLNMPEVLITPHASYISEESVTELRKRTCQHMIDGINGVSLPNVVNQNKVRT
ncbi:C-terminal binding protein [Neobacillus novalis]|uniref:C-terminal binding protein n=1 Tax=Neobacillus novalis TaxID=220687 RepID=A0AA95MI27_9BACI|nr:C-terminal binding protein [Neobacillus novalis]WHY84139.1 C-terminal binding protein [Neobacillus novalis]